MTLTGFIEKVRSHLVDDVEDCWRWASVHVAIISGGIAAYCADPNNWSGISGTLYSIPAEYRAFIPPALGFVVAFVPIAMRCWKQGTGPKNG